MRYLTSAARTVTMPNTPSIVDCQITRCFIDDDRIEDLWPTDLPLWPFLGHSPRRYPNSLRYKLHVHVYEY